MQHGLILQKPVTLFYKFLQMEQLQDILLGAAMILAVMACLYLYIRAIVDIHKRKFPSLREKALWLTLVITAPLIGSIFYFVMKRQQVNHRLPV